MKRISTGAYTKKLREEEVKLITEGGLSLSEAGFRWLLPRSTLANVVRAYKAGRLGDVGKLQQPLSAIEMGLASVKHALALGKMERDI